MSQKPGTVHMQSGETRSFEHVDPNDGYLFTRDGDTVEYIPWHSIRRVTRNYRDKSGETAAVEVKAGP